MTPLDKDLRRQLESVVKEARDVAEEGARAALNRLGVGDKRKPDFLSDEQAELRRRLRARGRQLGDTLRASGAQDTVHLVREAAYEHWHRMLFARYLAANGLLMHPELNVAVTLADCEELADEEGARDGFALAARYATDMLPQIFREDDPVLEVEMAPEHRNKLQRMVEGLPQPVFEADDSLGWVYQFWQAKRKDEVNASGVKIGADELPAVTQLFTEHYMVQFLLDNTLGAWWTARHPDTDLAFEYLRTLDDGTPAAGTFDGWPDAAADLTVMDPCMGSGHFLVAALPMLAQMRMREEGLPARDAVDAVLRDNLHGLEIDERCTQIAAFALALAAWTFPGAEGYRELPEMNLACSGLAPEGRLEDWETLAGDDERLQNGMRRLYAIFQDAPTLGSLIDPSAPENRLDTATFEELEPLLKEALAEEQDAETTEREVVAYGIARAAEMLSAQYHLVTTNVPYLTNSKAGPVLKAFIDRFYPLSSGDVATVFVERCRDFLGKSCSIAVVTPEQWLYATNYTPLRENLLAAVSWNLIALLGPAAFQDMNWWANRTALLILTSQLPSKTARMSGVELPYTKTANSKPLDIIESPIKSLPQTAVLSNPDARVSLEAIDSSQLLADYASGLQGLATADYPRFGRYFWEVDPLLRKWIYQQSTVESTGLFAGKSNVVAWDEGESDLASFSKARVQGTNAIGKWGIAVSQMNQLPVSLHIGSWFDNNTAVLIPKEEQFLPAVWTFCSSPDYREAVRSIDQSLKVTNATLVKVPFDIGHWQQVAEEKYPDGLPEPYSDDPTQWIFHGHPAPSTRPLQVAVARLLGYRWPAERDEDTESSSAQAMELSDEARAWVARAQELTPFADEDGIVCLPAVQGERPAIDRLRDLLAAAYGDEWTTAKEEELLEDWGYKRGGLARWLEGKFMRQHNKLFGHRPFIWHITDGHRDGFGALVNYHTLDRPTLERLTYTYLGDWIKRQEAALARGDDGAEGRLLAAQKLQDELKKIIEGEPPYDIFVRWKAAHEQPIGWHPDLNDGVLLNIKPFIEAGILKKDPNVRYTKDRGKNPEGAPWGPLRYNRYEDVPNDYKLRDDDGSVIEHLTNAVKRQAREN